MKLRKFAKCSLAVALIFGSAGALVGCKKDNSTAGNNSKQYEIYLLAKEAGVTDLTYEEWLVSIKGEKGDTGATGATGAKGEKGDPGAAGSKGEKGDPGINGNDGKDGATWLSGTTDPTDEGKNGDFYVNTTNWTIFKKENNTWNKIGSLKDEKHEETVELKANGVYKLDVSEEEGSFTVTFDENKKVKSVIREISVTDDIAEVNYFLLGLTQNMYLKVNTDGETAEFVNIDEENPEIKPNEAELNKRYTIDNQTITAAIGGMGGMEITVKLNGDLTMTGEATNPFIFGSNFTAILVNDYTELVMKVEIKDNYIYAVIGTNPLDTLTLALKIGEEKDGYTELKFLEKLDKEMLKYIVGTYTDVNFDGKTATISIFEDELYIYLDENTKIKGTWNYIPFDSSINEAYVIEFESKNLIFEAYVDCYSKEFSIYGIEYNYESTYYNNNDDCIELIEDTEDENNYIVKFNGEIVSDAIVVIDEYDNGIIYVTIDNVKYLLNVLSSKFTYAPISSEEIIENINKSIEYITTDLYNLPENTNVDSLLDEDKFYTLIGRVDYDYIYAYPNYIYINETSYTNENVKVSVGNNNFINKPLWKFENKKLYISSLLLKELMLSINANGNLAIDFASNKYNVEYSNDALFDVSSTAQITMGINLDEESTNLERNDTFTSNDGRNTLRIYLGSNDDFANATVYTIKKYYDSNETTYGFTKLDKIGDGYYLVFYPKWENGAYTENKNFTMSYEFVTSNGYYGNFTFYINLVSNVGE